MKYQYLYKQNTEHIYFLSCPIPNQEKKPQKLRLCIFQPFFDTPNNLLKKMSIGLDATWMKKS